VAQQKRIRLGTMRLWVRSLALLRGLRIQCCHELWYRSQMWLRSCVAMAVCRLAAVALIRPLAWEPPCAASVALKSKKKKVKNYCFRVPWWLSRLRIQHCHCCGSGDCCGMGSNPGLGTSTCHSCSQTNKVLF